MHNRIIIGYTYFNHDFKFLELIVIGIVKLINKFCN
jgi:hypothetical protein